MAEAWKYFYKLPNEEKAKCLKCSKIMLCKGSSTSGLSRHLASIHNIIVKTKMKPEFTIKETEPTSSKKIKFTQQTSIKTNRKKSLHEVLARLAAVDDFPLEGICNSQFICQNLTTKRYTDLPRDEAGVMQHIYTFYENAKGKIIEQIQSLKVRGFKFSLTLDEWTNFKTRHYIIVKVHTNNFLYYNLGLIRIEENCTALFAKIILEGKLSEFDLDSSDIVTITTDGTPFMKKFTNISAQQQCYNYAIHLAVIETIYKKNVVKEENTTEDEIDYGMDSENGLYEDNFEDGSEYEEPRYDIRRALERVRRIIMFFNMSLINNTILQNYIRCQHGRELPLILDSKTSWDGIEPMLERFLMVYDSIIKALIDLSCVNYLVDDILPLIKQILNTLKPIKLAVESLNKNDANLLTSEGILKFLFEALNDQNSPLSVELLQAITVNISKYRNKDLVSLIKYLQNKDNYSNTIGVLPISTKANVSKLLRELMNRLFNNSQESDLYLESTELIIKDERLSEREQERMNDSSDSTSLNKKLADAINKSLSTSKMPIQLDFNEAIKNEMLIYEGTSQLTENLQRLLEALKTIQPTSTDIKRIYSNSPSFCTKRFTGMSGDSLNVLCFLKTYFHQEDSLHFLTF